jgi:hypothetical protein
MTAKLFKLLSIAAFTILDGVVLEQLGLRPGLALIVGAALAPFGSWLLEETAARSLAPSKIDVA